MLDVLPLDHVISILFGCSWSWTRKLFLVSVEQRFYIKVKGQLRTSSGKDP